MTSILIGWVNEELQLDPPLTETTLAGELSSGFVLGALLHRHNQLPQHHKLRRRDTADSKIQNFCLLEPALCKLGVKFDANVAHGIMRATPGSAAMVLYQLKIALDKLVKFATPVSLHASRDGVQPLPNLPARPSKPQFDGARARLFEASVRLRADNPNDVLMKRHLRRFEDEAEKMENARLREKEAAVEELGRQIEGLEALIPDAEAQAAAGRAAADTYEHEDKKKVEDGRGAAEAAAAAGEALLAAVVGELHRSNTTSDRPSSKSSIRRTCRGSHAE